MEKIYDLIIIGGGASGLTAGVTASKRGKNVLILEKEDKLGKKILMTGNGKCNLSATDVGDDKYNDEFVKNVLGVDVVGFFNGLGLATKIIDGRVYPYSESALSVVNFLRKNLNCDVVYEKEVKEIKKKEELFEVEGYLGKKVMLSSGSYATKGKDSRFLYEKFGHESTEFLPALVPLTTDDVGIKGLSGLRAKCRMTLVKNGKGIKTLDGELLFKNDGLSGIVSMSLSTFLSRDVVKNGKNDYSVWIDFVPDVTLDEVKNTINLGGVEGFLQKAIAQNVEKQSKITQKPLWYTVKNFVINGVKLGDKKQAQVCVGGLKTEQFDKNLQSKILPNLYAGGEILAIDGECGGYNLHFAFACGIKVGGIC